MTDVAKQINGYADQTGVTASYDATTNLLTLEATTNGSDKYATVSTSDTDFGASYRVATDYGTDAVATATFADGNTSVFDAGSGLSLVDADGNTIQLATNTVAVGTSFDIGTLSVNQARFQVGANENQTVSLSIQSVKAEKLAIGASYTNANGTNTSVTTFSTLQELKSSEVFTNGVFVDGGSDALAQAIGVIDEAIDEISTVRGQLGAKQADNLQVQLDSLRVSYENLQASESTIRDTDMTIEMANFTKYQIMMQAGTAMLAQANQAPNNILQLLR
jgi:flagellin